MKSNWSTYFVVSRKWKSFYHQTNVSNIWIPKLWLTHNDSLVANKTFLICWKKWNGTLICLTISFLLPKKIEKLFAFVRIFGKMYKLNSAHYSSDQNVFQIIDFKDDLLQEKTKFRSHQKSVSWVYFIPSVNDLCI